MAKQIAINTELKPAEKVTASRPVVVDRSTVTRPAPAGVTDRLKPTETKPVRPTPTPAPAPVYTITMRTSKKDVSIELRGSSSATIDWGDGKSNSYTLTSSASKCTHTYTSSSIRTITIKGSNITSLNCSSNQLTSLSAAGCTPLADLDCRNNELTSLTITGCTSLSYLCCDSNSLTSLSVNGLAKLTTLGCKFNKLTATALKNLFNSLPEVTPGIRAQLYIGGNPGTESCDTKPAEKKRWLLDYITPSKVEKGRLAFDFELISGIQANAINNPNPQLTIKNNRLSLTYTGTSKADGDIYTNTNLYTKATVTMGVQKTGKDIEIILLYVVQEMQGDRTTLSLSKTYKFNNLSAHDFENSEVKSWWDLDGSPVILSTVGVQYRGMKKDWIYIHTQNKYLNNLRVKVDGSGVESLKGNMGVKGTMYVDYLLKTIVKQQPVVADPIRTPATTSVKGNFPKLATPINEKVRSVLGRGMYISGQYASIEGDSLAQPVLDLNKLNEYQRLEKNTNGSTSSYEINKEGSHEYSKKLDTDLSVNVSAGFGLCSFSNQTKKTFSEDRYNKEEYKFITRKDVTCYEQYRIQGATTPEDLCPFLTDSFLADLNKLTAANLVMKYGTHVMLGMKLGGRFDLNSSYLKSINNTTTINTFRNITAVSVNMTEDGKLKNPMDFSKLYEQRDKLLQAGDIAGAEKIIKSINSLAESAGKGPGGTSSMGNWGASASVDYSKTETVSDKMSNETFETKAFTTGGDHKLGSLINGEKDLAKLKSLKSEWVRGLTRSNMDWCDYVSGTLIPIYQFIPNGKSVTRYLVEQAYIDYIKKYCPQSKVIIGYGVQSFSLNAKGKSDVSRMSGDDGDREVSTQTGKETYWKVTMELVNIADGKMGVALWYEVHEGGKNVGRTKLQLKQSLEIPVSNRANVAIDENITQHRFVFDGTYVGQMHDWLDVTTQAMGCPFIDTTNHRFQIKMDGPGSSDCENIAMKGVLSVPYQYYSESVKTQ